jgi:hypothetical protein
MGYTDFGSYDDGLTGDGYGSGLTDSIDGYSGEDALSNPDTTSDVTGSDLQLDYSNGATGLGVSDLGDSGDYFDDNSLSGITDGTLDPYGDTGEASLDTNGEGTAGTMGVSKTAQSGGDWSIGLSSLGKFGASLAGVLTGNHPATVGGVPIGARGSIALDANGRPINGPGLSAASLSANHTTLIVGVVVALAAFLAFSDFGRKALAQ